MKRIALLVLFLGGVAYAQEATEPKGEDKAEAEPKEDPSQHFNFADHWFNYGDYDEWGGKFGDGVMTDEKTHAVSHEEERMSPPFVLLLVNFGLLLIVLGKWGAPIARKIAAERHDAIKTALDDAKKLRDQASAKLAEYEARIKGVDAEIAKLVESIRAGAEEDKKRILAAAETQAAQMKRDAQSRIAAEIELARAQLAREVTAAAATATEKLLRDKTTADDQKKLVSTFIAGIR